jgi:Tfp pilus assembly protein PilF
MTELKDIVEQIQQRNLDKALELCELRQNNNNKHVILNFMGVIHLLKNNLDLAEINFLNSIKISEKFEDPIKNLYSICLKKNHHKNLLIYAKKLIKIDQLNNQYNYQLAYAFELNNELDEAIKYYQIYLNNEDKDEKKGLNNIGCVHLKKNKPRIALDYFLKAINFGEDKIILNNTLNCYIKLRDIVNADKFYLKAKKVDNNFIEFIFNKAEYLILKKEINEAIKILEKNKDKPKFLITLLRLYFNIGENDKGNKLLKQSKSQIKENPELYNYLGLRSLYEGNFDEGWKYYEYRNSKRVDFFKDIPEWSREKINKKSIVVFNEQGLGDSLQFSKYLIPLTKIAGKVTFVVQENIKNLFREDVNNLSIETINTIRNNKYDFKIALGSLIKFFYKEKIEFKDLLIQSNNQLDLKWRNQISHSRLNVGLVWSGSFNGPNEPYRSIPLKVFKRIFDLDINFYCLQNEIWDRDLEYFKSLKLNDFSKYKLDEVASIIKSLDLIITVDTSLLHLSANLNKETWGILSLYPDWRWGEFNNINPYKTLKFFKQENFIDWKIVENLIYKELTLKVSNFK